MSGIFLIQPIAIPQSAAQNFAGGDVKHVSSIASAMDGDTLAGPSRQLAYRDVLLAEKINQLVEAVNNKDQFINLPITVTTLPAGATQIVSNYRIPPGFEARVLNAKIASSPSATVQLNVGYNASLYGYTTFQTTPVSTYDEFTVGSLFYGTGEFVVQLINASGRTATVTASVMLTMRPVSAQKGGIIGPGAVGAQGVKGDKGNQGDTGNPGNPGNPGPIGLTWRGSWDSSTSFSARDALNFGVNAWTALVPNTNVAPPESADTASATWSLIVKGGPQGYQGVQGLQGTQGAGFQGATGPQGDPGFQGFQGAGFQGDTGETGLQGFAGSQGSPGAKGDTIGALFDGRASSTAITTADGFLSATGTGVYLTVPAGSNYRQFDFLETTAWNGQADTYVKGISTLRGQRYAIFSGSIAVSLPRTSDGTILNWYGTDINVSISHHGTIPAPSDSANTVRVKSLDTDSFSVESNSVTPAEIHISVFGTKVWPL